MGRSDRGRGPGEVLKFELVEYNSVIYQVTRHGIGVDAVTRWRRCCDQPHPDLIRTKCQRPHGHQGDHAVYHKGTAEVSVGWTNESR